MKIARSFSLRAALIATFFASVAMAWVWYQLPAWRIQQRIDTAYYALDIKNDDVFRAGSAIMLDISQATLESLQEAQVVGAWVDASTRTLHVAGFFPVFALLKKGGGSERCTGNRQRELLAMIESVLSKH